jgi:hypothetical protein
MSAISDMTEEERYILTFMHSDRSVIKEKREAKCKMLDILDKNC